MFKKLWNDDAGVVTIEYLVLGTFLGIALIVGVATLARGINLELSELGNAVQTFNQGYAVSGSSACSATVAGGGATDTCGSDNIIKTAPTTCVIDDVCG